MRGTMDGAGLSGDGQAETGDQNSQVFFIECVSAAVVSMNTCSEAPRSAMWNQLYHHHHHHHQGSHSLPQEGRKQDPSSQSALQDCLVKMGSSLAQNCLAGQCHKLVVTK
ncbi:uncharacterized protein LOC126990837 isoform X4 [Eriocheir sinensis]|uniref:uncharacterized protein LOC126990837 isoform X4 n=1 Tax=Eriocheir sinensis TaxID=95602 RepID=UPI0021C8D375|nr:uncharacterized protein LOC126990837 isoform X4 [Eriocheir sinensis]